MGRAFKVHPKFIKIMDIGEFSGRFQRFAENLRGEIISSLVKDRYEFVIYVKQQLYSGLDGYEQPLRPTYMTDPYFKEVYGKNWVNEARRYMNWKEDITPPSPSFLGFNPRKKETPNLIVTGEFYSSITANGTPDGFSIGTSGLSFGNEIEGKYGSKIFKISPSAKKYYAAHFLYKSIAGIYKRYMS